MLILADANMPMLDEFFGGLGEIRRLPGRQINARALRNADVLLVRSVTRVDADLVAGSRLRFVGSATAGCDHVDQAALDAAGIAFAHAPGCNANAVADYVMAAAMHLHDYRPERFRGMQVGVVGCGACGGRVRARLEALGADVLVCDPPRARAGLGDASYVDLARIYDCELVSLHVPLIEHGADRTRMLLDVGRLPPGACLINAARGELLDGDVLLRRLRMARDLQVALDVWPGEPAPDPALVAAVRLATPHIAGYSLDGKRRGTAMLFDALCRHLGREPSAPAATDLSPVPPLQVTVEELADPQALFRRLLRAGCDIDRDDRDLRAVVSADVATTAQGFDRLRKHYRQRRDLQALPVSLPAQGRALAPVLRALGFAVLQDGC